MPPHPELLLGLSPALLRDLVTTFTGKKPAPSLTHAALAELLFTRVPTKKLASFFSRIAPFSTRSGRLAIHEAALATAFPSPESLLALPHADVAATLALDLERTTKPSRRRAIRRLFALASLRVARDLPERPTYELLSDSTPTAAPDPARVLSLLRRALGSLLVDTWSARDPDGTLRFALFLEQPTETRVARPAKGKGKHITPHAETPIAADVLRVFPDGTRVALTLAQPHLLPLYASALSLSLRPSFSLRPLQTLAPAALSRIARATRGLTALDVIAARHRNPSDRRVETRGPDALDPSLSGTTAGARTGYIDRTTLRGITDTGADIDAFLQLPYRIEISDRDNEPAFRAAFSAIGFFSPGALPDDARSLAPYEHGDWRWRAVLGDATFERLCKAKLLVRTQSKHVATHEHRMHGAGYVVREVPGEPELQYALAEDRALGARLVSAKDRLAWRLDERALASAMMRDLGAKPAPVPLALAGVLDLGVVALASGRLRIVYAMAEPPAGWVEALRRAAGVAMTPVVLVPKGHAGEANGMLEVELAVGEQLGAERVGRVLGKIAEAVGLEAEVLAWRRYDEDLVVQAATQTAWLTGIAVPFRDRAYGLVLHLAKRGGLTATKDLGASISSAGAPDVTARKARAEAEAAARRAGVDAGTVKRMIVVEGRKGYRLGVSARIV
jgi:hypothetical protein